MRHFDMATLRKLPTTGAWYDYRDATTPGLALRVSPAGGKSFYWLRRVNGRLVRVHLGGIEDFRLIDDVRAEAEKANLAARQGTDPAEQRRQTRQALTFGELWGLYLERYAKVRKRSWRKDERYYNGHLSAWKLRPLRSLHRTDAVALLARITAGSGPIQANRVRALGHKIFVWARRDEGLNVENPFADTSRNAERRKDRHLQPDELRRFWRAVQAEADSDTRDYLTLLLLTAVRAGTLAAARWADIDLRTRTWHIPAESMKAGKPLTLPLARPAVAVLEARRKFLPAKADLVFPSHRKGTEHLQGVPRVGWVRVLAAAELANLTPHDLRRTHATYGLNAGIPIEVLGKALGHTPIGGVTSIYAQAGEHLVRLAVERTVAAILRVAEANDQAEGADVLGFPLPRWAEEA